MFSSRVSMNATRIRCLPPLTGRRSPLVWPVVMLVLASCGGNQESSVSTTPSTTPAPSTSSGSVASTSVVTAESTKFPVHLFAALDEGPVAGALATELQALLETSANGDGLTATLMTPAGTWSGATGFATADRQMTPDDQMIIASITKTIVAAQVMRLVKAGQLSLDDLAADHLPNDLHFDMNGARIVDLLSMRSGIPQYFVDLEALVTDPSKVWTAEEKLATVEAARGPVGEDWEYTDTNYLLLGLIIEHVTGRPVAEVLRNGVLAGDEYQRLIYQPDERPTEPMALTLEPGATADAFKNGGGYLPSAAMATMFSTGGGMASDSMSVARWFKALCTGQVVSAASIADMADFDQRPGYGLGLIDRSAEYWPHSGAFGHKGANSAVALCFQDSGSVVVVLANTEHDVDTIAGHLVQAAQD